MLNLDYPLSGYSHLPSLPSPLSKYFLQGMFFGALHFVLPHSVSLRKISTPRNKKCSVLILLFYTYYFNETKICNIKSKQRNNFFFSFFFLVAKQLKHLKNICKICLLRFWGKKTIFNIRSYRFHYSERMKWDTEGTFSFMKVIIFSGQRSSLLWGTGAVSLRF